MKILNNDVTLCHGFERKNAFTLTFIGLCHRKKDYCVVGEVSELCFVEDVLWMIDVMLRVVVVRLSRC